MCAVPVKYTLAGSTALEKSCVVPAQRVCVPRVEQCLSFEQQQQGLVFEHEQCVVAEQEQCLFEQ